MLVIFMREDRQHQGQSCYKAEQHDEGDGRFKKIRKVSEDLAAEGENVEREKSERVAMGIG